MKKLFLASILFSNIVNAQNCIIQDIPKPKANKIDCINKQKPDYYMLAMSWSPQYCYKNHDNMQCNLNKFEFVVHGLWPQINNAKNKCEQPRNCSSENVDIATIKQNLCIMPSPTLINLQWQKHGSCGFSTSKDYFKNIQLLWNKINKPKLDGQYTIGILKQEFIKLNQGLKPEHINITLENQRYLDEVRICYDLNFKYKSCDSKGIPDFIKIKVAK